MNNLVTAALEENPIAFKREFETALKSRIEDLKDQRRVEIAQSIRVDGEVDASEE